jgi:uncharacterized protein
VASQYGDARSGKLADNIVGFGRTLRRAGVRIDSAQLALAQDAAQLVGLQSKHDVSAALEAVMVCREQDRLVFRELFDAYFRDPEVANKLLSQMLPTGQGKAQPPQRRPRVREALSPQKSLEQSRPKDDQRVDLDAAMTMSDNTRLRHADFNALSAAEYHLIEQLVREVALPIPCVPARRTQPGMRGAQLHWPRTLRNSARTGGEIMHLPRLMPREETLPLLILADVSGSMERYARLLLAFLHAATARHKRRDVFTFGAHLTELTPAFRLSDTDAMLAAASATIDDFAGGTRLGESLASLRQQHARKLVGRRTLVLIITDGLDTGEPDALAHELRWLKHHARRLLWLNPLLRFEQYAPTARGASVLHQFADGMLAVHNLSKLQELAASLAAVLKKAQNYC